MTDSEMIDILISEYRRLFEYLAKNGVKIPEKAIKEQEKDFAEKYGVKESSLIFVNTYKSNYMDVE